jgi:tetratricopeptide (TPR) repeat protein
MARTSTTDAPRFVTAAEFAEQTAAAWLPRLTQLAFVLAAAVAYARATMLETLRDAFDVAPGSEAIPGGPGAGTSLWLDLLCCVPALLVLLRRVLDRQYVLRWGWNHLVIGAFAVWALATAPWASDRFAAIVGAMHLIALAALLWTAAQLVRSWLRVRVVAGVCFGLLLVYLAQGIYYRTVKLPEFQESFRKNEETIRIQRGWEPGSYTWERFKLKVMAGEMMGFSASPNTFAAAIVLLAVVSAGVAIQRFADRDPPAWGAAVAVPLAAAVLVVWWTNSRTALALLVLATLMLAALVALPWLRRFLAERSRTAYWIGLAAFVVGVGAIVGHGLTHGTLFHDSLNFRWRYWVASARLIADHASLGVGWNNFGPHYLAYRLPIAAEEIRDPHNMLVRAFAELGVVGGLLLIAWLARLWWELTRPVAPPPPRERTLANPRGLNAAVWTFLGIGGLGVTVGALAGIDWTQNGSWIFLELVERGLYLCLFVGGGLVVALRSGERQELDERPAPWVIYGILGGLGVFLLHNLVDMSLFETGPMTVFALVAGAALGARAPSAAGARKRTGWSVAALAVAAVAWLTGAALVAWPVSDSQRQAARADEQLRRRRPAEAFTLLRDAYYRVPANAEYARRAAMALLHAGRDRAGEVVAWLDIAIRADPTAIGPRLTRAAFELQQTPPNETVVREDFEAVLRLDPNDVDTRLRYAKALDAMGHPAEAARAYRQALDVNDQLHPDEPERLAPARVEEVEREIDRLVGLVRQAATTKSTSE